MITILRDPKLRKRCIFTVLALCAIRFFYLIPTPGVNTDYFRSILGQNQLLGIFNMVSGNGLSNLSVMALSISPYITATIILQLFGEVLPKLKAMQKGKHEERKKYENITILFTIILAMLQGTVMAWHFGKSGLLQTYNWFWILIVASIWTFVSTVLAVIGKRMGEDKEHFIGNGISLILLLNVVSAYPQDVFAFFQAVIQPQTGRRFIIVLVLSILGIIGLLFFTVLIHSIEKRIPISNTTKLIPGKDPESNIPIKLCPGSVIPMIFASGVISTVVLIFQITKHENHVIARMLNTTNWFQSEALIENIGIVFYVIMIFAFSFYYMEISINPEETADMLRKNGSVIPGIHAGKETADYLRNEMRSMIAVGALALMTIAILPMILSSIFGLSQLSFLGSSIIITVNIIIETRKELSLQIKASKYTNKIHSGGLFRRNVLQA